MQDQLHVLRQTAIKTILEENQKHLNSLSLKFFVDFIYIFSCFKQHRVIPTLSRIEMLKLPDVLDSSWQSPCAFHHLSRGRRH